MPLISDINYYFSVIVSITPAVSRWDTDQSAWLNLMT